MCVHWLVLLDTDDVVTADRQQFGSKVFCCAKAVLHTVLPICFHDHKVAAGEERPRAFISSAVLDKISLLVFGGQTGVPF
jgi:hypothetical protein